MPPLTHRKHSYSALPSLVREKDPCPSAPGPHSSKRGFVGGQKGAINGPVHPLKKHMSVHVKR